MIGREIVVRPAPPVQADTPRSLGTETSRPGQAAQLSHKGVYVRDAAAAPSFGELIVAR